MAFKNLRIQCRIAPSLGELEGHPYYVWGTSNYEDTEAPTVFMGLYSLNDFNVMRNHKGKKWIFWCGSDIRHMVNGYWLDDTGSIKLPMKSNEGVADYINTYCENWVENTAEQRELKRVGINAHVGQSFMGNVKDYELSFQPNKKFYASVSGNNFNLYNWRAIDGMARRYPEAEFHLYGNTVPWETKFKNVIVHGRVSKEQMNSEIKHMHGGIRWLPFDGFSEIVAKSILWGQWPVSMIAYKYSCLDIDDAILKETPNVEGSRYYKETLNDFPWNTKYGH